MSSVAINEIVWIMHQMLGVQYLDSSKMEKTRKTKETLKFLNMTSLLFFGFRVFVFSTLDDSSTFI